MPFTIHPSIAPYVITDKPGVWASEGISAAHAQVFLRVSLATDAVILTRTPGAAALTLLAEGYDAKGFHVKGKSCDWGPWAGFICAEPRFNKSGMSGAAGNLTAHLDSLTKDFEKLHNEQLKAQGKTAQAPVTSSVVVLELSDARVQWLETQGKLGVTEGTGNERRGTATLPGDPKVAVPWLLVRDPDMPRWRVYYDASKLPAITNVKDTGAVAAFDKALAAARAKITVKEVKGMTPVLALTNPYLPYKTPTDAYRNALTGDFDLFAVWPKMAKAAEYTVRVGGMGSGDVATEKAAIYAAEATDTIGSTTGNMSNGVLMLASSLNIESYKIPGQSEVNRVFHSDEGGRPGMDSVDESVAFVGTGRTGSGKDETVLGSIVMLKHPIVEGSGEKSDNAKALAAFALSCARQGYAIFLNTGWVAAMKSALSPKEWAELDAAVIQQHAQLPAKTPAKKA